MKSIFIEDIILSETLDIKLLVWAEPKVINENKKEEQQLQEIQKQVKKNLIQQRENDHISNCNSW